MRYVGRHRAPRLLILRRPVVGGVAAAVVLAVPVLYVTGSFGDGLHSGPASAPIAEKKSQAPTPVGAATGVAGTLIPVDGSTIRTSAPGGIVSGVPVVGASTGVGVGVGVGVGDGDDDGDTGSRTTSPTTATKTTSASPKPVKTTKPPTVPTKRPPATSSSPTKSSSPPTTPPDETTTSEPTETDEEEEDE